jgi:RadC-like JAB domain
MTDESKVHRFVTIEQVVRATRPDTDGLPELFKAWGLTDSTQEALWVIAFDNMMDLKTIAEIARGGWHDVLVYPATILAAVLSAHTDRFYIAHNHPSGPVSPTPQDLEMTANVMAAANAAGLSFEDHIITGPKGWYSFHDEGLLIRSTQIGSTPRAKFRKAAGNKKR